MNPRQKLLLQKIKERDGSFPASPNPMLRDVARFLAFTPERSQNQVRSMTVYESTKIVPFSFDPDSRLAGEHFNLFYGDDLPEDDAVKQRWLDELGDFRLADIREVSRQLQNRYSAIASGECTPGSRDGMAGGWPALPGAPGKSGPVFLAGGWIENHSVRDYGFLLKHGFGGLKRLVERQLERFPLHSCEYVRRENFLRSAMTICDAGLLLGRRHAELARQAGEPEIARNCLAVESGAKSFPEAVQLLWFGHLIACVDDGIIHANSIGRLDQLLQPYYEHDLERNRITREEAVSWMIELAIKLYLPYDVQAITLGGVDADGNPAICEMSRIILEATLRFGEIRDLSVRVTSRTPDDFLEQCAKLVLKGGGIPFFFNDYCFITALAGRGIELEDARNYAPIGCVELTIPGKANSRAVSGWFNLLRVLELTLFGGRDPHTGEQLLPESPDLTGIGSWDELMARFEQNVECMASRMVYHCRREEQKQRLFGSMPAYSLLTPPCLESGRDITDGGARYDWHSICLLGVPDTADSLVALKRQVFESHQIPAGALLEALKNNFAGSEALREQLLEGAPKYGNGDDETDRIAAQLSRNFIALMDRWSEEGNRLFVHLFSFYNNVYYGESVGAMPDGRRAGEPLAYSLSPHQGRDREGVTMLLRSLAKQPHREAGGASAAIIDLHPSLFEGEGGIRRFVALLKSALAMGVGQMQWNVVSAERLEQAKADPEHYGNIPVRVAGYSQLFKLIPPEIQDHLIARTKHRS